MAFVTEFDSHAQKVEARLEELLPAPDGPLTSVRSANLWRAMRYCVLNGGKRLRPFLVTHSARLFGLDAEATLNAACAVECMHCYSLVHDDLPAMDDDDLRRGLATVHKKFDEATAILVGDGLQALAFEIMSSEETHAEANVRVALISGLARASGHQGMVGGQALDLAAEDAEALTTDETMVIQSMKTGALIEFSLDAGALLGQAPDEARTCLQRYGRAIGLAFQVADDLLDAEGDMEKLGKATGKDESSGKKTFISLLGAEGARRRLGELEAEAIGALEIFGQQAAPLIDAAKLVVRRDR